MLITGFPAAAFGTNCYVVAPAAGEECVVVDPGVEVVAELDDVLREHRLQPVAVLLTHGHIDHTFSVTPVCGARGIPAYLHPGDDHMLADPLTGISPETAALFGGRLQWTEPEDDKPVADGDMLALAGLEVTVDHAPGHTPGSVAFRVPHPDVPEVMLSGDLLFAGSIGRTDLPGGEPDQMMGSLARTVLTLDDEVVVLPRNAAPTRSCTGSRRCRGGGSSPVARPTPLSGFPEWLPRERIVEQQVLDSLRDTFELHGFCSVETRAVEPLDQLLRKGETDREIYTLRRLQSETDEDTSSVASLSSHSS